MEGRDKEEYAGYGIHPRNEKTARAMFKLASNVTFNETFSSKSL